MIEREVVSAFLAKAKVSYSLSVHVMTSVDERSEITSSSGEKRDEQVGFTRARNLYAPMNDFIAPTFSGGEHEDNTEIRCGLAV